MSNKLTPHEEADLTKAMDDSLKHETKPELVADRAPHVVTAAQAETIDPQLPPAGYRREEELVRRKEELQRELAELESHDTFHRPITDWTHMEDREILQHFERDPFTGEQHIPIEGLDTNAYAYTFVLCKLPRSGTDHRMIDQATRFGWALVTPSTTHTTEDGKPVAVAWNLPINDQLLNARGICDTVLMWMPRQRYEALQELARRYAARRQLAAQATSLFNAPGARGHSELDDPRGYVRALMQREGGSVAMAQVPTAASAMARDMVVTPQDVRQMREGTLPGVKPGK